MSLEKIIAISGKPGLFELMSQTRGGFLVTSLIDGKRQSISMRNNVSVLNEIAVYTYDKEVPLKEVFIAIREKQNGEASISHKSSKKELESYFLEVLPDYDEERVYASDIKKIIQWYNLLHKADLVKDLNLEAVDAEKVSDEEE
ncbi:DUF5606 family protein [Aquimarina agarilytica]|uniref:DUF5606 family protein n=1 Tax=Aquimarina agarilytica TaxID=1087449 RepID=UPI0002893D1C|nr:DUF5606 domain-containing protein [Aquimarina agarilytica]